MITAVTVNPMTYYPYVPSQFIQSLGADISRAVVSDVRQDDIPVEQYGRSSSKFPNLQNYVKRTELGTAIRQAFTVDSDAMSNWLPIEEYRIPPGFCGETSLEADARMWASYWHRDQKRKYTNEPYIEHPAEVVAILRAQDVTDPVILAAAWLHDVVEDCAVRIERIATDFGSDVGYLVSAVTDVSKPSDGNRAARKAIDLQHIRNATVSAKTIKLADIISNSKSIIEHDPKFAKVYLPEKRAMLNVLKGAHQGLWNEADRICREAGY